VIVFKRELIYMLLLNWQGVHHVR